MSSNSSTSESTAENTEQSSNNENFFSLTEDDTPQNSPMKSVTTPPKNSNKPMSVDLHSPNSQLNSSSNSNFSINNGISPRPRKLSTSSMASDVSFRLPSYDSPSVSSSCIIIVQFLMDYFYI